MPPKLKVDLAPSTDRRFNGNAVFRWEYRPGSFVTIVWNQVRADSATTVLILKVSFRAAL